MRTSSLAAAALLALAAAAGAATPAPLAQRHEALRAELERSPFGRPLLLQASARDDAPSGEVLAVLQQPFARVARTLGQPEGWCALMLLQTNVKACSVQGEAPRRQLVVAVARRHTDSVDQAERITFEHRTEAADGQRLAMALVADQGPVGTADYALRFEAVPLPDDRTVVQLTYAYRPGLMARMATSAYLSTAGRNKVGFTVTGQDEQGRPQRVGGIQGIAERNTMRYFLAMEAVLRTADLPPDQRLERRLQGFHAALERHPQQLHELTLQEYLALKRRELGEGAAS
ncbi:hypothetical protein [Aquincola tertiaricarbonis]|uniref:hypothetical protein n=1 Tax=Aquincola tertiaricarbonis TaxID=391953 RepID=UPI000614D561|nr:hypothetical protein [Aquincola tertiaricarbonis]